MDAHKEVKDETEIALAAVKSLREQVGRVFEQHLSALEENSRQSSELGGSLPLKNGSLFASANGSAYEAAKVFSLRESPLTVLFKSSHIRTIYHICLASVTLLAMNLIIQELITRGSLKLEIDLLCWFFGKFPFMVITWILMFCGVMFFVYPGYYVWSCFTSSVGRPNYIAALAYLSWIAAFIFLPIHFIFRFDLPIGSSALIVCEQVRFIMKVHSFVRENYTRSVEYKRRRYSQDKNEKDIKNACPTLKNFIYFLFAPTLIYRNVYPSHDHVSWSSFLLSAFGCVLPASMSYLLAFYAVLHSWMNAFAEMLRFGDRMFYMDWWNCTTMPSFYRKWNCIVYDWLHAYVYQDICALLGGSRKIIAKMAVFLLSAVVHEYILTISLRLFNPVLFVEFFFGAGPVGVMLLMRSTKGSKWNFCLWLMIMLGNGILYCAYCREWYARQNCACAQTNSLDFLLPCSWTCSSASVNVRHT
ncbi:MBOAT family protein [Trichuris suis]|nr:MBOAT family protein [Trichuris suis]